MSKEFSMTIKPPVDERDKFLYWGLLESSTAKKLCRRSESIDDEGNVTVIVTGKRSGRAVRRARRGWYDKGA